MSPSNVCIAERREPRLASSLARGALWLILQTVRLPLLALLVILEPLVRFVLSGTALLGVLMALLLEFSGAAPKFPFWGMMTFSLGCFFALALYYVLLRALSR